jgi:hypothetical protein
MAPSRALGNDGVALANADGVLLEAQHDVAAEGVARQRGVPRIR